MSLNINKNKLLVENGIDSVAILKKLVEEDNTDFKEIPHIFIQSVMDVSLSPL